MHNCGHLYMYVHGYETMRGETSYKNDKCEDTGGFNGLTLSAGEVVKELLRTLNGDDE